MRPKCLRAASTAARSCAGVGGIGSERGRVDTGGIERLEVVGMPVGAAGNQRDRVALLAESVCDGHAEPRANADYKDHGSGS